MKEIPNQQLTETDGGFVPIVIGAYVIGAKTVMIVSGIAAAGLTYWATH